MKSAFLFLAIFPLSVLTFAQQIHYELSAPNAAHHEAEIELTIKGLPKGPALFRMSRSSPGRYATHEFGKNVYNVKAVDANGKSLPLTKTEADVYRVAQHTGTVKLQYTIYGNYADGTYMDIDPTQFHLNMPATFMWVKGLDQAPITLHLNLPQKNWQIATQLKATADAHTFTAPGLQYFMDSPVKAGKLTLKQWTVTNPGGKEQVIRLALQAAGSDSAVNAFTTHLQKIVREAKAVFGELPAYDYGQYTFLASINPYVQGDGMEHRNSTVITIPDTFNGTTDLLDVFAHEFFHSWNVERIRPKSLQPFQFEKSNVSDALWIAEGFTQYYGQLLMKRAGLVTEDEFRWQMAGLINTKENTPGARFYTPVEASQHAVFVDAGVSVDRTNYNNMFASYYPYGGALALALDLQLRQHAGKTMDNFMQELWRRFGKKEIPYTLPNVQEALAAVSTPAFATNFFQRYVYGHESLDYAALVKGAGWELEKTNPGKAWIGNPRYKVQDRTLTIASNTSRLSPLYEAGVDVDDQVLELGGQRITSEASLDEVLKQYKPGQSAQLVFSHRGEKKSVNITFAQNPLFVLSPVEKVSDAQKKFANRWYGPQA